MDAFIARRPSVKSVTCTDSQNLGVPGPDLSCVPWSAAFCTGSSSPAAIHLPQELLSPSSVPGGLSVWQEVPQRYFKGIAVEKDHQDLTHSVSPASPGMRDTAVMGQEVLTSDFGGGLSARCIEQLQRGEYKSPVLTPIL